MLSRMLVVEIVFGIFSVVPDHLLDFVGLRLLSPVDVKGFIPRDGRIPGARFFGFFSFHLLASE
jgi:hypothetical protein